MYTEFAKKKVSEQLTLAVGVSCLVSIGEK